MHYLLKNYNWSINFIIIIVPKVNKLPWDFEKNHEKIEKRSGNYSGWSSTKELSCSNTALKRCTTEIRWYKNWTRTSPENSTDVSPDHVTTRERPRRVGRRTGPLLEKARWAARLLYLAILRDAAISAAIFHAKMQERDFLKNKQFRV